MNRTQLLLSVGAIILVILIYQLPRVVVENEQVQEVGNTSTHSLEFPEEIKNQIQQLRRLMNEAENADKKANFAHSLAGYYLDYGLLDSAVRLGERIESWVDIDSHEAMEIYFKAYERSQKQEQAVTFASKAKEIIERLLDKDPTDLALKNKLAMTLVVSENPMAGVALLREILETDEANRQAILNLGLLAVQSGQFERAKERFEKLLSLNANDFEAKLYLAVSMIEINQQSQAKLLLEEILGVKDSIPAIKMMAMDYLNTL